MRNSFKNYLTVKTVQIRPSRYFESIIQSKGENDFEDVKFSSKERLAILKKFYAEVQHKRYKTGC